MSDDLDDDEVLALTLFDSFFCDNIGLYFKLIGKETDDNYIDRLKMIAEQNQEKEKSKTVESNSEDVAELDEIKNLKEQLAARDKQLKDNEDVYEAQLQTMKIEYDSIKKDLTNANQKIQELHYESQKAEAEIASLQARVNIDDLEEVAEVSTINDYDYISLCEVLPTDFSGKQSLLRLADIERNGTIEAFRENEDIPKRFGNRSKLFMKNGPSESGAVGVWKWRALPNLTDPSRDFIESEFIPGINPIKIVTFEGCKTADELLEIIKTGIEVELTTSRILFSVYLAKGQFIGFLCRSRDLEQNGSKIKLIDTVMSLPRYDFSVKDTVRLSNDALFYRSISIGIPSDIINIRDPFDIVKKVIISRNSWQIFKQKGKTRGEWKSMRDLLEGMDTVSVVDDIVHAANCSYKDAQCMLDEFIKYAKDYIDGNSIEDSIIAAVITVNPDLMERCKNIIMEDWIAENLKAVEDAEKTITELKTQIEETKAELIREEQKGKEIISIQKAEAEKELAVIRAEHDSLEASLQTIKDTINAKERLATDVEASVEKRIRQAQADAADFIAGLAFVPQVVAKQDETDFELKINGYTAGYDLISEDLEESVSWEDTLDTISFELRDAGVIDGFALPLAAYMYAAYLNRCPLIMIGPNSNAIIDAFSGAIFGRTVGTLECSDKYSAGSIRKCFSSSDKIIKITNPFSNEWVNRIPEIITKNSEKYFFVVHPYSEDLLIEPKSLYSYMLPIFTDLLIEKAPAGQITGGKQMNNYKEFQIVNRTNIHGKILTEMHAPLLVRSNIQTLLSNMHAMLNDKNIDYDVLFALFPYAYATMQMPLLLDAINNEKKTLSVSKYLRDTIIGMYSGNE